jgi:hypothetical protein
VEAEGRVNFGEQATLAVSGRFDIKVELTVSQVLQRIYENDVKWPRLKRLRPDGRICNRR